MDLNPYQKLGVEFDPFGIANKFNLPFCLAEAFKKLACAGIDGRVKAKEQDIKEAIYSVKRAIDYFNNDSFEINTNCTYVDVKEVKGKYIDAFNFDSKKCCYLNLAIYILCFAVDKDIKWLNWCVEEADLFLLE